MNLSFIKKGHWSCEVIVFAFLVGLWEIFNISPGYIQEIIATVVLIYLCRVLYLTITRYIANFKERNKKYPSRINIRELRNDSLTLLFWAIKSAFVINTLAAAIALFLKLVLFYYWLFS